MSTADGVSVAVGIGGLIAAIFLGLQNNRIASQQNEIFRDQNRIFAAQEGIKMPESPSQKNKLGLYWPALAALAVALVVGVIVAKLQISTPKPVGAVALAVPWVLVLILAFWSIVAARKRPDSDRSKTGSSALLSPLQIEALTIAKELREFADQMEAEQEPDVKRSSGAATTSEELAEQLTRVIQQGIKRESKIRGSYRVRFGDRLTAIVDQFAAHSIPDSFLESQANGSIDSIEDARRVAEHLASDAFKVDGIRVYPPKTYTKQELDMMPINERDRRSHQEPGFAETWGMYEKQKRAEEK
jgi:hypothetical protein